MRFWILLTLVSLSLSSGLRAQSGERYGTYTTRTPYIDARHTTVMGNSKIITHYWQPLRGWRETVTPGQFLNGIGVARFEFTERQVRLYAQLLAESGVRVIRFGVPFRSGCYDRPGLCDAEDVRQRLEAARDFGLIPVLTIDAHESAPAPALMHTVRVSSAAPAGTRTLTLDDVTGLVLHRSGLDGLPDAAGTTKTIDAWHLVTQVQGKTITLSQPIGRAVAAGETITVSTLKAAPLWGAGTAQFAHSESVLAQFFADVTTFARDILGPGRTFHIEWINELTVGPAYYSASLYYNPNTTGAEGPAVQARAIRPALCQAAKNAGLPGVCVDGVGNTTPGPSAYDYTSEDVRGSHAYKRAPATAPGYPHPWGSDYETDNKYLLDAPRRIDALGNDVRSQEAFEPRRTVYSNPLFRASALMPETLSRDLSPLPNLTWMGDPHGRYSNADGRPRPVGISEAGTAPQEYGIDGSGTSYASDGAPNTPELPWRVKTRDYLKGVFYMLRGAAFYAHFRTYEDGGPGSYSIIAQEWGQWVQEEAKNARNQNRDARYPDGTNGTPLVDPGLAMTAMKRLTGAVRTFADSSTAPYLESIWWDDNRLAFRGNGSAEWPDQPLGEQFLGEFIGARSFYFFLDTDRADHDLAALPVSLVLNGVPDAATCDEVLDPVTGQTLPATETRLGPGRRVVRLDADDDPRLLVCRRAGEHLGGGDDQGGGDEGEDDNGGGENPDPTNIAPTTRITSPENGARLDANATIRLRAEAGDTDGTVSRVEFWANGTLLATDTQAPYRYTLRKAKTGTYTFTTKAFDNDGAVTTSAPVEVRVGRGAAANNPAVLTGNLSELPEALAVETVYPNPFADATNVVLAFGEGGAYTVEVFDLLGRRVYYAQGDAPEAGTETLTLALPDAGQGVYILHIRQPASGHTVTQRIVKMH